MKSSYDAEDMMKRSMLSSLLGFKKKSSRTTSQALVPNPSSQSKPKVSSPPQSSSLSISIQSVTTTNTNITNTNQRTPLEIYREIVNECEIFERSATASPISELSSCPPSPIPSYSSTSHLISPHFPSDSSSNPSFIPSSHISPHYSLLSMSYSNSNQNYYAPPAPPPPPPPPYMMIPPPLPPYSSQLSHPSLSSQNTISMAKPIIKFENEDAQIVQPVSIEDIVKMVVASMRDSGISNNESPEDILRRKRQQNNEAAARYRKRQRNAKEQAEGEMDLLAKKNEELKMKIAQMEQQIADLKQVVLEGKSSTSL